MARVTFALVYSSLAKTDKETSRAKKVSWTSACIRVRLRWHVIVTFLWPAASLISDGLCWILYLFVHVPVLVLSFNYREEKSSQMFKATWQLRRQLNQSSLDHQQWVERRRVTVCSRLSCQAYYCNDFYCFKMSRHTPETQCMKVISFHCEQTEASLKGNRPTVWPFQ